MKGWIYVITNQAVRGLLRVGVTPRDPVQGLRTRNAFSLIA